MRSTDSPEAAEARRRLLPFRDLFAVLFFVAVGSLIDPVAVGNALPQIALVIGLVVVAKVVVSYVLARAARFERPGQLAIGLGQVGEFSYVLVAVGATAGVVAAEWFAATLAAVVVTIAVSAVAAAWFTAARPAFAGRGQRGSLGILFAPERWPSGLWRRS